MPPIGGHPSPTPRASADPETAAWHKCGATEVPPKEVLNAELPGTPQLFWASDVTVGDAQHVLEAYGRTNAYLNWAISKNQLPFLQGTCVAAPLSHTEDNDIKIAHAAKAAGGHAVFEPDPLPTKVAVRTVPVAVAERVQSRIHARPAFAVIVVAPGATVWIVDASGHHIKKYAESDHNTLYITLTLGSVADDGIGIRFVQQWQYACSDPEVAGLCDGV